MIRLKNIAMSYPVEQSRVTVLKDVSLHIQAGESVAVIGPSGSGKTTLLLLLAGLDHPDTGAIEVQGTRLDELSNDALADLRRDRMGIVFQSFHLIPSLTALGNVTLPLEIAGDADAEAKAQSILNQVGLGHRKAHYPMQLSGGEQQRVAIARAVAKNPTVLFCDEPTGALDSTTGRAVLNVLKDVNEKLGATVLIVTHAASQAAMADRVIHFADGAIREIVVNKKKLTPEEIDW